MNQAEQISRILRDIGVFLLGLAAIIFVIHFAFFRKDPEAEMRKAAMESFSQALKQHNPPAPK